jgi:hypothetical protein
MFKTKHLAVNPKENTGARSITVKNNNWALLGHGSIAAAYYIATTLILMYFLSSNPTLPIQYFVWATSALKFVPSLIIGFPLTLLILSIIWLAYSTAVLRRIKIRDAEQCVGYGMIFGLLLWVVLGLILTQLLSSRVMSSVLEIGYTLDVGAVGLLQISSLVGFFVYGLIGGILAQQR